MRIGIGYDVHRLVKKRKLILGGVSIPYRKGLWGHSDADVLIHAVCDALLGAAAQGDIGKHFPNTDSRFKGIQSVKLLSLVRQRLSKLRYVINNIDTMVLAEEPVLRPYVNRMRKVIADVLHVHTGMVSIKATTNETLGFIGKKQGIAAYAVCLLRKK